MCECKVCVCTKSTPKPKRTEKNTKEEKLEVIAAAHEGKEIEFSYLGEPRTTGWFTSPDAAAGCFRFDRKRYRVAKEPYVLVIITARGANGAPVYYNAHRGYGLTKESEDVKRSLKSIEDSDLFSDGKAWVIDTGLYYET